MITRRASCSCGAFTLTCGGEPVACPRPAADGCGTPLAPCTTAGAPGQVCILGSTMVRGSNDPDLHLSFPRRAFYVSSFWLDVDEVTVALQTEAFTIVHRTLVMSPGDGPVTVFAFTK